MKKTKDIATFSVIDTVIMPTSPKAREFIHDWNTTQEALGRALNHLGNGLGELHAADSELAHEEEITWHAFYLLENATVDLGLE